MIRAVCEQLQLYIFGLLSCSSNVDVQRGSPLRDVASKTTDIQQKVVFI